MGLEASNIVTSQWHPAHSSCPSIRCNTNMGSSSSSSDTDMIRVLHAAAAAARIAVATEDSGDVLSLANKYRGGSKPGKASNRVLSIRVKCEELDADFFVVTVKVLPYLTKANSDECSACPGECTLKQEGIFLGASPSFHQKPDATGLLGGTTDLKLYTALQMIAHDRTAFPKVK